MVPVLEVYELCIMGLPCVRQQSPVFSTELQVQLTLCTWFNVGLLQSFSLSIESTVNHLSSSQASRVAWYAHSQMLIIRASLTAVAAWLADFSICASRPADRKLYWRPQWLIRMASRAGRGSRGAPPTELRIRLMDVSDETTILSSLTDKINITIY